MKLIPHLIVCSLIACNVTAGRKAPTTLPKVKQDDINKITAAVPKAAPATPKKSRKVLIFWLTKGFYHGCIPTACKAFELLGEKTGAYTSVLSNDMAMFSPDKLKKFDAVLLNNTTHLDPDESQRKALLDFVRSGKGFIAIHSAADNFYKWKEGAELVGGLFDGHPWTAGGTWAYKVEEPEHPLNKAWSKPKFAFKDEIYQFKAPYDRSKLRVLVSIDWSDPRNQKAKMNRVKRHDKDFAISWIHPVGKGRSFFCGFGHRDDVFWNKELLKHYLAGIQYALGDLEAPDAPRK